MNRLTRDGVINRALDLADSPTLDAKDRPSGTVLATALSVGWLQDGLDYFFHAFPWQAVITASPLTLTTGQATYAQPAQCIRDYKDGIVLAEDAGRLTRRGLSHLLNQRVGTYAKPQWYTIQGGQIRVSPTPDKIYAATLWFYQLPSALSATTVPNFPSDLVLVKYVMLRAQEWMRSIPPNSAEQYARGEITQMQRMGLGQEAEADVIPLDRDAFPGSMPTSLTAWMGPTA